MSACFFLSHHFYRNFICTNADSSSVLTVFYFTKFPPSNLDTIDPSIRYSRKLLQAPLEVAKPALNTNSAPIVNISPGTLTRTSLWPNVSPGPGNSAVYLSNFHTFLFPVGRFVGTLY